MALFKKKKKRTWSSDSHLTQSGPLTTAYEDLETAARIAAKDRKFALYLLGLPVRDFQESMLRGCFLFLSCTDCDHVPDKHFAVDTPLAPWEASLTKLDPVSQTRVLKEARGYVAQMKFEGCEEVIQRLEHIELVCFHAQRLLHIQKQVVPCDSAALKKDTVSEWLSEVGVFCQSDAAQRAYKELFLALNVTPYQMEVSRSTDAFSALCQVANDKVNDVVALCQLPLQAVVKAGRMQHPHVYDLAALSLFKEYTRCKKAIDIPIHTLHTVHEVQINSFFIEKIGQIYVGTRKGWEGPYAEVGCALTRWVDKNF
jgi:hypothetical protein